MNIVQVWFPVILSIFSIVLLLILLRLSGRGGGALGKIIRDEFRNAREESSREARNLREEITAGQRSSTETMASAMAEMGRLQTEYLESVAKRIRELTDSNEVRIENFRSTIDIQLKHLQQSNEEKLDQMRKVVDDKLQSALERRLSESFKIVGERLEAVQHGLGEMQALATGVGDLKRMLTNVKVRGTWGEVQLGTILEQILTPDQYGKNVQTREGSGDVVEYAIRLPGSDEGVESCVWLPIDSKFPQEDYLRLVDAAEAADADAVQKASAALIRTVQNSAKDIHDKYLNPPRTTDFAIMFLPTEGLYSEVLRQPGLLEKIQQNCRVVIAGPTTLSAILNSLRMGFRTLAIEKRSAEVWNVLAAVKTEFGKFGETLAKVKRQLNAASNTIDQTGIRTRAIARKLRDVEQPPNDSPAALLGFPEDKADVE